MVGLLFTILLFGSCAYAFLAGGKEGKAVSLLLVGAALLSIPASYLDAGWHRVHIPVLLVDVTLFVGLTYVALRSRRYWPVWAAALHLVSISTHVARAVEGVLPPLLYFALQSFWSLPGLLIMVGGIMLDRRAGLAKGRPWKALGHDAGGERAV